MWGPQHAVLRSHLQVGQHMHGQQHHKPQVKHARGSPAGTNQKGASLPTHAVQQAK